MEQLGNPTIKHSYRKQDQVADLAKEGAKKQLFAGLEILTVPPIFANDALWVDILGTEFTRKIKACKSNSILNNYPMLIESTISHSTL